MSTVGNSPAEVARLFDYNRWANARAFEGAAALNAEELSRSVGGSFTSAPMGTVDGIEFLMGKLRETPKGNQAFFDSMNT